MAQVTVISDEVRQVAGTTAGERVLIEAGLLPEALGWELKPEGLCRDDMCVPVRDPAALTQGSKLDLAAVAAALGQPAEVDADAGIMAMALPAEGRRRALDSLEAPPFTLADLAGAPHSLDEWRGQKKLLVAFASW
jgi:hypothetical protein